MKTQGLCQGLTTEFIGGGSYRVDKNCGRRWETLPFITIWWNCENPKIAFKIKQLVLLLALGTTVASRKNKNQSKRVLYRTLGREEARMNRRASAIKELEDSLSTKIYDLENRVKALEELLARRDAQVQKKDLLINLILEEKSEVQERMSVEIGSLRSELKEKKILLAAHEKAEWRSIGQPKFWQRILGA